jgi:hypothetical protein
VQVGDDEEALVPAVQPDPVGQAAGIVAEVQPPGRPVPGKHPGRPRQRARDRREAVVSDGWCGHVVPPQGREPPGEDRMPDMRAGRPPDGPRGTACR